MNTRPIAGPRAIALALALAAMAAAAAAIPAAHAQSGGADPDCTSFPCGRILSIRQTTVKQSWTPLGTLSGFNADTKVVTSFKIGPDLSNQGIVMLGAGGGAAYQKSPNSYEQPRWEVTIKLDSGQKRVVTVAYEPFVREGDRVRVAGNSLELVE
jgi:outer membrane lipoprotein SlyB